MFKILFNTILGLVLIFIWSRFVNLGEIVHTISKVNLISLIPVFFFMLLSPVIRALRFKVFLAEVKKIKFLDLILLNGVAMMLNFFIPIRAGEVAKGIYLNNKYDLNLGKALIWTFLDRFVDFLVVLLVTSVLVVYIPTNLPDNFVQILTITISIILIVTYLAIFQADFSKKLVSFLKHLLIINAIKMPFEMFSHFILDSFSILRRKPKDLFIIFILTILAYLADAAIWYFTFISLGVTQDLLKMYLGQLLSALTYLIPAAPGYVGSAEASGLLILSGVFGINNNLASSMIVLFHILSAIFVLIYGLAGVTNLKIDLGEILKKALKRNS